VANYHYGCPTGCCKYSLGGSYCIDQVGCACTCDGCMDSSNCGPGGTGQPEPWSCGKGVADLPETVCWYCPYYGDIRAVEGNGPVADLYTDGIGVKDPTTDKQGLIQLQQSTSWGLSKSTGIACGSMPNEGDSADIIGIAARKGLVAVLRPRKPADVVIGAQHTFPGPGWNMMSVPLDPAGSAAPEDVFYIVELGRTLNASELSASALNRYSDSDKSYVPYDEFDPGTFGTIKPRDGYWFNYYLASAFTLRYGATPRGGDVDFTLDYPGWNIVGYGHTMRQSLGDPAGDGVGGTIIVNNGLGGATDTFRNAWYTDGWISGPLQTWDPANLSYFTVGVDCPAFEWNASVAQPWFGYWFNTNQPSLLWRQPLPSAAPACEP